MQGSARKDVVFGAARVYTVTVPGPKWKSWLGSASFKVSVDGVMSAPFLFPVSAFAPAQAGEGGTFHLDGSGVAELNPASPGETILSTFITGLGVPQPPQLTVTLGGLPAVIVSLQENVGELPLEGVYEMQWIVPGGLGSGPHLATLSVGGVSSAADDDDVLFVGSGGLQAVPVVEDATNLVSQRRLLSPGVQAHIFGQNLNTRGVDARVCVAGELPLPTALCGTRVLVDNIPSPILRSYSDFVEVVLSFDLTPGLSEVVVETGGILLSEPFQVTLETHAPGIFLNEDTSDAVGLFLNSNFTTVTRESPAEPGGFLSLFAVGLGPTDPPVAAGGDLAPSSPVAVTVTTPTITIGEGAGTAAVTTPKQQSFVVDVISSVLMPSFPGMYQVAFSVPEGLPDGLLPLTLAIGGQVSNTVLLPVGLVPVPEEPAFTSVSSASFAAAQPLAAEVIAAGFGAGLATGVAVANDVPLPTELLGTKVEVSDSQGTTRAAPLFFVSPTQINYLIPNGTAPGTATVKVTSGAGGTVQGTLEIERVAPSLYAVNAQGTGVAVAFFLRVFPDNSRAQDLIFDPATGASVPIDLGPEGEQVYLLLYGTGVRGFTSEVTTMVGGESVPVLGAVPQGDFVGLDQINIGPLPRSLAGRGEVNILLTADGKPANTVTVNVR